LLLRGGDGVALTREEATNEARIRLTRDLWISSEAKNAKRRQALARAKFRFYFIFHTNVTCRRLKGGEQASLRSFFRNSPRDGRGKLFPVTKGAEKTKKPKAGDSFRVAIPPFLFLL